MSFFQSVLCFFSIVVIAWMTRRIITYWKERRKIEETKLFIYNSCMPFFAECYARAVYPNDTPYDPREFLKKKTEILGTLQIMAPAPAIDVVVKFCDMAERGFARDASFDGEQFHRCFTQLKLLPLLRDSWGSSLIPLHEHRQDADGVVPPRWAL